MAELSIADVVGGGDVGQELALEPLSRDIPIEERQYNPESYSALILYYHDPKGTITLFSSGSYSLAGAKSIANAEEVVDQFLEDLSKTIDEDLKGACFEFRYIVCTADLGQSLDLSETMLHLGVEHTEYEPEQFPGLFYQPEDPEEFCTIFSSGKVVLNSTRGLERLQEFYEVLKMELDVS
jgi:transcription initiation factor TFIID TATA-box-binding protein